MTPKLLPTALIVGCTALLAFAFIIPSNTPQPASTAYAQSTPSVSFTQEEVQGKEGSTIYLRVKLDTPVTKTTKVTIKLTPDAGTTSRDIPGLTGTKTVTFYKNGTQTKTVAIRTSRTAAEGDKSLTASITKVGNTTVQGDTARILVKDQRSSAPLAGNQNTNTTATTTPPVNCAQYEGVIPGESRRARVQMGNLLSYTVNPAYSISSEAQAQLAQMQGDFGWPSFHFDKARLVLDSGVVYAFKFKTTEYNQTPGPAWFDIFYTIPGFVSVPTGFGAITMSFSECPGDFTSPKVLEQRINGGDRIPVCVGTAYYSNEPGSGTNLGVAIRGKWSDADTICLLDENKTYYLNVTAGFAYSGGTEPSSRDTPFIGGLGGGTGTNYGQVEMIRSYRLGGYWQRSVSERLNFEFIKNRSAFYAEKRRIEQEAEAAAQRRVEACRNAIGQGPRTGTPCAGLPMPAPTFN